MTVQSMRWTTHVRTVTCILCTALTAPAAGQARRHDPHPPTTTRIEDSAPRIHGPDVALGGVLEREPYLQMVTDTSVILRWRTFSSSDSQVDYGTTSGNLTLTATSASSTDEHEVLISGLTANTLYYYAIGAIGSPGAHGGGTPTHYFKTAPAPGASTPFVFWAVGDGGNGTTTQLNVMNAMLGANGGVSPDVAIYLGDIAYNSGTDSEFTNKYFAQYDPVIRNTVVWPTLGNHEGASTTSGECAPLPCSANSNGPYYEAFTLPTAAEAGGVASGTEAYYSFDYGSVHFISLNSNEVSRSSTGPMAMWLTADLAANTQLWTIAFWHHPPYTKGTHDSDTEGNHIDMRENLLPILEAGGVDVVMGGHSHIYERSFLIDGTYSTPTPNYATLEANGHILDSGDGRPEGDGAYLKPAGPNANEGAVYVTAGHGGQNTGGAGNHPVMFFSETANGSCLVDVSDEFLVLRNVRQDGAITDTFTMQKQPNCVNDDDCSALDDQCHDGVCNGLVCTAQPKTDGTACNDGIACTSAAGSCSGGACVADFELCTLPELCNPKSGQCELRPTDPLPIVEGDMWHYFKGTEEPSTPSADLGWTQVDFEDSTWLEGRSGFGYADGDDATALDDMQGNYSTFYTRRLFDIPDTAGVLELTLSVDYDDAYVCYINGTEVARSPNISGTPPLHDAEADGPNHEATAGGGPGPDLTSPSPSLLVSGNNVIACQGINGSLASSDASLIVELRSFAAHPLPVAEGDTWRYFKGVSEPTPGGATIDWTLLAYDDSAWLSGPSGFGYDDCVAGNPGTLLADMQGATAPPAYVSVYVRKPFWVDDPARVESMTLRMNYDDSFVGYVNGVEIASNNVSGSPPAFDTLALGSHECGIFEQFDIDPGLLVAGINVLAIQGHNRAPDSSDFALIPELTSIEVECFADGDCDDGVACTSDVCNFGSGACAHVPDAALCDDGNSCTTDSCHPELGCIHDGAGVLVPCDDGNLCTIGDACQGDPGGTCMGFDTSSVDCNDHNACTADSCDPLSGCANDGTGITAACDDENACTMTDVCQGDVAGTCQGTPISGTDCDDNNPCTVDACDADTGCTHDGTGVAAACDDGNDCTADDVCQGDLAGTCQGTDTSCDDDNACTVDTCDAVAGCTHDGTDISSECDDGESCTMNDRCQADVNGTCAGTWCAVDLDFDGVMGTEDFTLFTGCFGACYGTQDPCRAANFDDDPSGCVGTSDYSALVSCYGLACSQCSACFGPGQ